MNVDLNTFYPSGARVLALPSWRNPRLVLPAQGFSQRWKQSSFFPAFRSRARAYRLFVRLKATARLVGVRTLHSDGWPLQEFAKDIIPELANAVILMRASDPAQRSTAQLWDRKGRVVGYLRYAETEIALSRLQREFLLISRLPDEIGPEPLKYGTLGKGEGLLKACVPGKPVVVNPPPPGELVGLLDALIATDPIPLEMHPWVARLRDRTPIDIDSWLEPLANRNWPVTIQHGDLTPWNLLRTPAGGLRVVDWEYGTLEGFPYLDLTHYILQTAALIYHRDPSDATREAVDCLLSHKITSPILSKVQALAIVRLAAFEAYLKTTEDGQDHEAYLQKWRRAIWSEN